MANHLRGEVGECDFGLCIKCAFRKYKIVRTYVGIEGIGGQYKQRKMKSGLSLAEAKVHCTSTAALGITSTGTQYFDSYYEE